MDFLLIANQPPYPLQHLERNAIYQFAYELTARHYVIDLACFYSEPEDFAEVPRYEHLFRQVAIIPKPKPSLALWQARLKKTDLHFPSNAKQAWSAEMWETIQAWVNDRAYGFVHLIGDIDIYEYHPIIKRIPNLIQSFHIPSQRIEYQSKAAELATLKKYESWLYAPFEGRVLSTSTQTSYLQSLLPEHSITTIPIGVDTEYYVPTGHEPRQAGLLFIGDFSYPATQEAAQRLCERIFPPIKRAVPQSTLFILGKNPPPSLRDLASDAIVFIENAIDLRPYFELATLVLSPFSASIGLQHDLVKALAMMTPLVATPQGLEGLDPLEHDRDVLIANTDDEFIRASIRLLREDQTRLRLQLNGRERVKQHYAWEHIGDEFEDLYAQITRQHGVF